MTCPSVGKITAGPAASSIARLTTDPAVTTIDRIPARRAASTSHVASPTALAGAPGPVQAVLLTEAVRGGVGRGPRALVGASVTFGSLLALLALGLGFVAPDAQLLRVLKIAGGGLLMWLAADAIRSDPDAAAAAEPRLPPPTVRGSLAVLLSRSHPGGCAKRSPSLAGPSDRHRPLSSGHDPNHQPRSEVSEERRDVLRKQRWVLWPARPGRHAE